MRRRENKGKRVKDIKIRRDRKNEPILVDKRKGGGRQTKINKKAHVIQVERQTDRKIEEEERQ